MNDRHGKRMTVGVLAVLAMITFACTSKNNPVAEQPKPEANGQVAQAKAAEALVPQIHEDKLEACYVNFLKTNPQRDEGTLLVRWDLNEDGEVSTTKLVESDLKDKKFTSCVIENLKQVQFPDASSYPKSIAHKYNFKRRSPASL